MMKIERGFNSGLHGNSICCGERCYVLEDAVGFMLMGRSTHIYGNFEGN
jgi:hypothetical protein